MGKDMNPTLLMIYADPMGPDKALNIRTLPRCHDHQLVCAQWVNGRLCIRGLRTEVFERVGGWVKRNPHHLTRPNAYDVTLSPHLNH